MNINRGLRILLAALFCAVLLGGQAIVARRALVTFRDSNGGSLPAVEFALLFQQIVVAWVVIDCVFLQTARRLFPERFRDAAE